YAKDALLVVDDFAPPERGRDGELQNVAERLFRAAGNQQGRSRLGGNGTLRDAKAPRGLVLATGEKVPQGRSIRARLLGVEVGAGDGDRGRLSECQQAGADGQFAAALGGFVAWIAGHYEESQAQLRRRALAIRGQGRGRAVHARLPVALAELQSG